MRYYSGDEPCAGCDVPGNVRSRRYKHDICRDCHELIRLGKLAKSEQKTEGFATVQIADYSDYPFRLETKDNRQIADIGLDIDVFRSQSWHYVVNNRIPDEKLKPGAEGGDILAAIRRLLKSVDQPEQAKYDFGMRMEESGWREGTSFVVSHETALAIFHLWDIVGKYTHNVYHYGYSEGSNLLTRLASGNASIEDFNKATIRK